MFNKYNIEEPSKPIISRVDSASKLVLRYDYITFLPPHIHRYRSLNKNSHVEEYRSNSLHSKPFWEE